MTLQLIGASGSGKSVQLGLLAQHVYNTQKRKSIIYHADPGGYTHLAPHIKKGYLTVVDMLTLPPWGTYKAAVEGKVPAKGGKPGQWEPLDRDAYGLFAYEGLTSWSSKMMQDIRYAALAGKNIGGASKLTETLPDGTRMGHNSQTNYKMVQDRIKDLALESMELQVGKPDTFVAWTALDLSTDDEGGGQRLLGVKLAGKALAGETPQWFNQTYHLCALPGHGGGVEYRLYTRVHVDPSSPNVWGLANTRAPLELDENGELVVTEVPDYITPANIVKALALVEGRKEEDLVRA